MDYTNRFDRKSEIYAKARPKYAADLFRYFKNILQIHAGSVFADVGSGTGIFTGQLLDCGYKVFAVEPNLYMRKKAEETLSRNVNFVSVNGSDGSMNLPDESIDFVTAAQSFHWFDCEAFKKECKRVLKPHGKVILVYNLRDENAECIKAIARLRSKYNSEFHGFSNGMNDEKCRAFFDGKCTVYRSDNTHIYNRQEYVDRVLSSSYSLDESDEKYTDYLTEINKIFDKFSLNGKITVPTDTVAYIGEV